MRAFITTGAVVILVIVLSLSSFYVINSGTAEMSEYVSKITENVSSENWEGAKSELAASRDSWNEMYEWWSVIIDHGEIEDIEFSLRKLDKYVEEQKKEDCLEELQSLKMSIDSVYYKEKPSWSNIF